MRALGTRESFVPIQAKPTMKAMAAATPSSTATMTPAAPPNTAMSTTTMTIPITTTKSPPVRANDQPTSAPRRPRARRHNPAKVSFSPMVPRATSRVMIPCRMATITIDRASGIRLLRTNEPTVPAMISSCWARLTLEIRSTASKARKPRMIPNSPATTALKIRAIPKVGRGFRRIT